MPEINVIRTQWLILSMGIGIGLTLAFFVAYMAYQRPRDPARYIDPEKDEGVTWKEVWSFVPWILILTIVGIVALAVCGTFYYSVHPPNF